MRLLRKFCQNVNNLVEMNPFIMIVIGVLGISLSSIFVKFSSAPSSITASFRLVWTVLLMSPAVLFRSESRRELRSVSLKDAILSIVSGIFLAVHFVLWFESLKHTSVVSSTTIVCTEVIWVSFGYCFFLRGRLSWKAIGIIGITLLGSVLIAFSDGASGESHLFGDFLALAAAVSVAIYVLIGRIVRGSVSTTVYTFIVYRSCGFLLLMMSAAQGFSLMSFGLDALVVGFLLAVFSTILGHSIFSWCLKYFSPSFVSASKLCEPVIASIFAFIFFGELPSFLQILGGTLIIGGVYLYSRLEIR